MKFFFDTEFMEDGETIELVSIGMVSEQGDLLYLENRDADLECANEWVKANVVPHLNKPITLPHPLTAIDPQVSSDEVAGRVERFVADVSDEAPEFWAYYADYDWVVLCQSFGTMLDLPKGWPKFCLDLKQEAVRLGNPRFPKQLVGEHHALADAMWNMQIYHWLRGYEAGLHG